MLSDHCADQARRTLELRVGVENVRADAQVLAARVDLHPFLVQVFRDRAGLRMYDGQEGAVRVADARNLDAFLEEEQGKAALLGEVVCAQALDAEFEGKLQTGE